MEPGGSVPHSQWLSNNSYPELNSQRNWRDVGSAGCLRTKAKGRNGIQWCRHENAHQTEFNSQDRSSPPLLVAGLSRNQLFVCSVRKLPGRVRHMCSMFSVSFLLPLTYIEIHIFSSVLLNLSFFQRSPKFSEVLCSVLWVGHFSWLSER